MDVFGVGSVLFHALYGSPPNRRSDEPIRFSGPWTVPAELEAICRRALQTDPVLRYESASDLAADLQASLDQRVVKAYEAGSFAELRKWIQRNKALATALAGVVLALVAALAVTLLLKAEAERRLRLGARIDLAGLVAEADELWPVHPDRIPDYLDWIQRAEALTEELPTHLDELEVQRSDESSEARWWEALLRGLVQGLEELQGGLLAKDSVSPGRGWSVPKRLAFAEHLLEAFGPDGVHRRSWEAALPAIRGAYPGLIIETQLGLVPLGPDPESGLWEFADLSTGSTPERDASGKLILTEETGFVFVLIPGGILWMGAQRTFPDGQNYDPLARADESPVHELVIAPFFISKYEMNQGQWLRITGENPSRFKNGSLFPVEQVSLHRATAVLRLMGLGVPSEAQWEYAARGGTRTPWFTGEDSALLRGHTNLADQACKRSGKGDGDWDYAEWEDGFVTTSPVGSFEPNPFGLHDTAGNVWELCSDIYGDYANPVSENGERVSAGSNHVTRGGDFQAGVANLRVSYRDQDAPDDSFLGTGIRPVRALSR